MAGAEWSIAVGILVYILAIIFGAIYYFRYKKVFLLFFIASIATYIFAVMYTWDVFLNLNSDRNWVLLILLVSTILMFFIGNYFKNLKLKPANQHSGLKQKDE